MKTYAYPPLKAMIAANLIFLAAYPFFEYKSWITAAISLGVVNLMAVGLYFLHLFKESEK